MFGKLLLELGDIATVKNPNTGITCETEFKVKVRYVPTCIASCRAEAERNWVPRASSRERITP